VVVFSVAVGLSLMVSERKQALLESLGTLEEALQRIAGFVVGLAPYGVFAIAGHAAGTMRAEELLDLQVYTVTYVLAALILLGTCGAAGLLAVRRVRLARWAIVTGVLVLRGFGGLRLAFESIDRPYQGYQAFIERSLLMPAASATERESAEPRGSAPVLERIRASGVVRVGWTRNRLPLVFRNDASELVGFDVEMAHTLARDLGVKVEFVQIDADQAPQLLDSGVVDIVMSGFAITPERMQRVAFSDPYLEETLCFIVPDHRRDEFSSREAVQRHAELRLAIPAGHYYVEKIKNYLPQAELVKVTSPREFFRSHHQEVDGLMFSAESGSAWTLIYPQLTVAVPPPTSSRCRWAMRRLEATRTWWDS
jgi:ABC-type amino acid transport substrate-binding protein